MTQTNFVLVHGAWHGGWCWRRVADILRAKGHRVFTPTLTGLCDRSHLLSAAVDLSTHVTDIVNLVRWEELSDVVLCGHSYGGMVITGVAERALDRLAAMVYLDAFIPESGQSMSDINPARIPTAATVPAFPAAYFHVNEQDCAWVDALCTPQPAATFTERLVHQGAYRRVPRKLYVRAGAHPQPVFERHYQELRTDPAWSVQSLPCGHDVMIDMPQALADILLTAV